MKTLSEISGVAPADVTTIVTLNARRASAPAAGEVIDSSTAAALFTNPTDGAAAAKAVTEIVAGLHVTQADAIVRFTELKTIPIRNCCCSPAAPRSSRPVISRSH